MPPIRIGSRGSQLALWQANHTAGRLREHGHAVDIQIIKTSGDKIQDVALSRAGGVGSSAVVSIKGMFTKEIEDALAVREIDLAVHSLKDLPTELPAGFELAAIPQREDPGDVFLSLHYARPEELPRGAHVGTSSLRRQAQLRTIRADIEVLPLRGNVDTRLRKLNSGEFDAIILAAAGVNRLGLSATHCYAMPLMQMCPAAGQGALALEIREGDTPMRELLRFLDDPGARIAITCERAALAELGGGCQVPIGAYAILQMRAIALIAVVARPDGSEVLREEQIGEEPIALGRSVGQALLAKGADRILRAVYGEQVAVPQQP
jgi:hydroxymethylbilane synthase